MQRFQHNSRALESFRIFPYIAWALIIAFCFVVYSLTIKLQAVTKELNTQTEFTEAQVKARPANIKNFEPPREKPSEH